MDGVKYEGDRLIEGHGVEDKKKSSILVVASKIAYFPFALIACCQLAMWASFGTDVYLLGDPDKLSGGHFLASEGLLFLLLPIWFVVFLIACVAVFFVFRRRNSIFGLIVVGLAALSIMFFRNFN
ncbi:hypothetical protein [Burkholderia cepacia]|uniref:hypothetical protein n=1 Tax=Burkholderia cepacia TaxID=292 RepID=UPI00158F51E3|nr:hypothetical protein [Burkholderia cepacia]